MDQQRLSFSVEEAKGAARSDMDFFGSLAMPDAITFPFTSVFKAIWQLLTQALLSQEHKTSRFAIGLPRAHGKSTVIKLLVLFAILFTKKRFIIIVGKSSGHAENLLADIVDMLDEPNIKAVFGDWRAAKVEMDRNEMKIFTIMGKPVILAAYGFDSDVRGLLRKNARPDFMIFDDAQTRENALEVNQAKAFRTKLYATWLKLKGPICTQVYIGNMYPDLKDEKDRYCCMLRAMEQDTSWTSFVTGAIQSDNTALCPDLWSVEMLLDDLRADSEAGEEDVWFAEVQNDPKAGSHKLLDSTKIKKVSCQELGNPHGACLIIDPATAKNRSSDDQVITHVVLYDGKPVARKVMICNDTPKALIRTALLYCMQNNVPLICVEDVAYQHSLLFWFSEYLLELQIVGIDIQPISPGKTPKNTRILTMFKQLTKQEIWLDKDCYSLIVNEADAFNPLVKSNKDNIIDTVAYIDQAVSLYRDKMLSPLFLENRDSEGPNTDEFGYGNNNLMGMIANG